MMTSLRRSWSSAWTLRLPLAASSDPHRHQHIPVLILGIRVFGPHLACGLRVLELQPHLALVAERFEEVENVAGVEALSLIHIYHFKMGARQRMDLLLEPGYELVDGGLRSTDPLNFTDIKPYKARLRAAQEATCLLYTSGLKLAEVTVTK